MYDHDTNDPVLDAETLRVSGALLSAQTAMSRLIQRQAVHPTGFDPTTVDLLVRLDRSDPHGLRASELAEQLLMSPSHISRSIDRAEASLLVARHPDPRDRRASVVRLTDRGRDVLHVFEPLFRSIIADVVEGELSSKEAKTLVTLLRRVAAAARRRLHHPEEPGA